MFASPQLQLCKSSAAGFDEDCCEYAVYDGLCGYHVALMQKKEGFFTFRTPPLPSYTELVIVQDKDWPYYALYFKYYQRILYLVVFMVTSFTHLYIVQFYHFYKQFIDPSFS